MTNAQQVPTRFNAAVARLDGDVGLLRDMAAITSEDLPDVKEQTEQAIADGNCDDAVSGLHKLKGMLSTFEDDGIVLDIQDMLEQVRKGAVDDVRAAYQQHREDIQELIDQVAILAAGE